MVRLTYKPSSVFDNHLSRIIVANNLKRLSDWRATIMSLSLASDGVYITTYVATSVVSFYLAFPPLHYKIMRYISVALSLKSPLLVISQRPALWCSDFPHFHAIIWSTQHYNSTLNDFLQQFFNLLNNFYPTFYTFSFLLYTLFLFVNNCHMRR